VKFNLVAVVSGALFGAGLAISGFTQPSKIFGFLDVSGAFDASLPVAMLSGVAVLWMAQRIARRVHAPIFAKRFPIYDRTQLDGRLLIGAALFGVEVGACGHMPRTGPGVVRIRCARRPLVRALDGGGHARVRGMASGER
jgi:hypothetical protein